MAVNVGCEKKAQILQQWREIKDKHKCYYDLDFVNELFEEYLRFITIKVASAGSGFDPIPSELVDSMWQAHILCTRLYTAFCSPLTKSKGLIHRNQSALTIPVSSQTGYRLALAEYRRVFGEDPVETHPRCWDRYTPCHIAKPKEEKQCKIRLESCKEVCV